MHTSAPPGSATPRVLLFGWFGCRERHLQPLRAFYEKRGAVAVPFVADNRKSLGHADGYRRAVRDLVDAVARDHEKDPRPLVIHAFSNHGFCATLAFLEEIESRYPDLFSQVSGLLFDSAPGIPEAPTLRFTMSYVPRSAMPGILAALGLRPAYRHPILTPILSAAAALVHVTLPGHVNAFASTSPRMLAILQRSSKKRVLFLWGDGDELVPHQLVEAFANRCENAGIRVERHFFPGSAHVRHLIGNRSAYLDSVTRFLDACAESPRA